MKGMDLFLAVNDVNDLYITEAAENIKKAKNGRRIYKIVTAAAAVLLLVFVGNKVLFLQGDLRYKIVKVSSMFQPQDEMQAGRERQVWKHLPPNKKYPCLFIDGVTYAARLENCDKKEPGRLLGTVSAKGREYVRIGLLLYFDVEILHKTKADVYEIIGEDKENVVAVRFEKGGECYVYEKKTNEP
ncbi:MAG: hypothetical protein J1E35_09315 [Lachnospiraceae bacterium]|nr:hypothetical protein [Lachnospiraceae bacterium]